MRRDNDTSNDNNQSSPRCIESTQDYVKFNSDDVPPNTDSLDSVNDKLLSRQNIQIIFCSF